MIYSDIIIYSLIILKYAEDKKDAKRYRRIIAFIATALGGMILAKLPDFIAFCIKLKGN